MPLLVFNNSIVLQFGTAFESKFTTFPLAYNKVWHIVFSAQTTDSDPSTVMWCITQRKSTGFRQHNQNGWNADWISIGY